MFSINTRDAEFNTLYDAISNIVVGDKKTEDIRNTYKEYDERSKREEVIAYAVEAYSEAKILSLLEGEAKELYNEILTDNLKDYGETNGRGVESYSHARLRDDRSGQRNISSLSTEAEESGRIPNEGYTSSERRGKDRGRILEEIVSLEQELGRIFR